MSTLASQAMTTEAFYGHSYPRQNRRFYLALVFSLLLFPVIAAGLIAGTLVLIVPAIALLLWISMRIFFAHMLGNSVLVSTENYPRIFAMLEDVQKRIGYTKPIFVFVYEDGSFNAYMRHLFFRRAIFLNSQLLQNGVSDPEVRWVMGRFVGYMRARHQAGMLGWVIRAAQKLLIFNVFLLPYERALVYTGDRLALAEIDGDVTSATSAMQKILVGRELGYSINPEGLIAQHRRVCGTFFGFLARLPQGFPHTTARYVDLVLFTKAFFPDQFKVFQATNPGLPSDLERLGIAQRSESGVVTTASVPRGWACALLTLAVVTAVAAAGWLVTRDFVLQPTTETSYLEHLDSTTISNETSTNGIATRGEIPPIRSAPVAVVPDVVAPQSELPPNTHYVAAGRVEPDEGCRWLSEDPGDMRVGCK